MAEKGIGRWIFYGPIVPYLNDDDETALEIAELAMETEAELLLDYLRLRPRVIKSIKGALGELGEKVVKAAKDRTVMYKRLAEIKRFMEKKGVKASYAFPQPSLADFLR